ncbi:MAG TPA: hypothetical protein DDX39_03680 [Bacteroidales bacterium]|nr:MAG: hypothetical protein A2W98_12640 [Bacteroidetes bacterium GWF2_33_38]OFY71496.1 MAG: hypothetical protein A2265_12290 [Bacteroidetes bacterium RIFOXYA12_FULL_33_9]OFY90759.1 MAG: hypothetical protein A2236_06325 [Bacteroidetes bacterium RIFOXYA2_FULL_33_7]HBF87721.1 hypothetical protein [Bacteroidales bacterium]
MFLSIHQYYTRNICKLKGKLFRFLVSSKNLKIGKNFQCDTFPSLMIDKNSKITIGDNVIFKRNVEIRAHATSEMIIENNVKIDRGVRLLSNNNAKLHISEGARIGLYTVFNGGDSIFIGKKVLISGFVYIQTSMHNHEKSKSIQEQGYSHAPIVLHDDAWLGAHVSVLPGVTIGKGGVVGSNAVVTKNVAENEVVAGVPAKVIKERE